MVNHGITWSKYHKYGQHTRNMVNIPEMWSKYQKYGQNTKNMVNIQQKKEVIYVDIKYKRA